MDAYMANISNPGAIDSARKEKLGFTIDKDGNVLGYIIGGNNYNLDSTDLSQHEMRFRMNMAYSLYAEASYHLLKVIEIRMDSIKKKHCRI